MRPRALFLLLMLAALIVASAGVGTAHSVPEATFTVNTAAEGGDPAINGVCDAQLGTPGDQCTLRAAIMEANATVAADTITLPAGTYVISLNGDNTSGGGDLDITNDLTINGVPAGFAFPIIEGANTWNYRVFVISSGADVQINNVIIRKGADISGGGIYNNGNLSLSSVVVTSNIGPGIGNSSTGRLNVVGSHINNNATMLNNGGGIHNSGVVTLTNTTIYSNSALSAGGLFNGNGTATIQSSSIYSNTASNGSGAIYSNGMTTIISSAIYSNTTTGAGGGITNALSRTLVIADSTINNNTAGNNGGGIINSGTVTMTNSTLSGNQGHVGGGISNGSAGSVHLTSVTITANSATSGGGGISSGNGLVSITNSIVGNNTAADCFGTLTSGGYNLVETLAGCTLISASGDITGLDPKLAALAYDGGSGGKTHALLPGSPAINAGSPATPGSGGDACPAADQRGISRPQNGRCDIGAYEAIIEAVPSFLPLVLH